MDKQVTKVMNIAGGLTLFTNICLTFALKYLWGVINLFQFLVFISQWTLSYPSNALFFLKKAKNLVFMDWIPIDSLIVKLSAMLGISEECDDEEETCNESEDVAGDDRRALEKDA